jgi:hypothetical protein
VASCTPGTSLPPTINITKALDLGLHLVARVAGADAEQQVRRQMDYDR